MHSMFPMLFLCCHVVVMINELPFLFKSLEKKQIEPVEVLTGVFLNAAPTIGSITWWRRLHKLLPDGKY